MTKQLPINFATKSFFGAGAIATGVKDTSFNIFLLFFYTQVVGLSPALAGSAIFAALVVDAISDPLVGYWSDRLKSEWGRRHPFMYASAIPMGISFYLLFHPPADVGQTYLFAWMACFAIIVRLFMTLYAVPAFAMIAEMTSDYDERTSITSFKVLFGWVGGIAFAITGYLVFFVPTEHFTDGRLNPQAYHDFSLLGAVLIVLAILTCATGTHHLIPHFRKVSSKSGDSKGIRQDFRNLTGNHPFLILVGVILVAATAIGFNEVMGLYMFTYYWGLSSTDLSLLTMAGLVGTVVGFVMVPWLSKQYDRKPVALSAMAIVSLTLPTLIIFRSLGLLPENGTSFLLLILGLSSAVSVFAAVTMSISFVSMIADTIDMNELKTGQRQEAIYTSAYTFSQKATSGLGGFIAGIVLQVIEFPTGVSATDVSQTTLNALGLTVAGIIFSFWMIAFLILRQYPLSRTEHAKILLQIKQPALLRAEKPTQPTNL